MIPQCEFDLSYGKIEVSAKEQTRTGPTSGPVDVHVQPDDERVRDVS